MRRFFAYAQNDGEVVGDSSLMLRMTFPSHCHPEGAYSATEGSPHFAVACKNKHRPTICNDGNAKTEIP